MIFWAKIPVAKFNKLYIYIKQLQELKKIREEQVPDVTLNEELLKQTITELKNKISGLKKDIFEEDNFIQIIKKEENISKKNLYEDNINILNSGREQFNNWKENITKENVLHKRIQHESTLVLIKQIKQQKEYTCSDLQESLENENN
ncbi:hypothetical protein H8356DRAFT_1335450 [Neocallimastix lanati (nom. inval.)]|nr:hypothetical protein H8356DRAFT_1335450 [Neocallimastix sp. JGI-2020a]